MSGAGRSWVERTAAVLGWGPVAVARRVIDRYESAGGGLLASGLAYSALFAMVPLTILLAGIVGVLVADPARQAALAGSIGRVLPPLRDLVRLVLDEVSGAAGALSIIGAVALVWGSSRFVVAFQDAIARIFGFSRRRGFIASNLVAVGAIVALLAAAVLAAATISLSSFQAAAREAGVPVALSDGLLVAMPPLAAMIGVAMVYRFVPAIAPDWGAIVVPAVVVAIVLTALTQVFVYVAPRLIGAAAAIGTLATAFAALAWLGLSFQALLIGAAWVRERDATWGGAGGPEPGSTPPPIA
ncbi:MAG: YihY/virulence factor BrkB family protein [Candidatus Limnocylindrales bacterium]